MNDEVNLIGENDLSTQMMDFPLKLLYLMGQHPLKSTNRAKNIIGWSFILITFFFYYLCIMQLFHLDDDRETLFKTLSSISSFTQGLLKIPPCMYYKNLLRKMLLMRKYFWRPNFSEKENEKIYSNYRSTINMVNHFKNCLGVTAVIYYCQPIIRRGLFMPVWIPPYKFAYETLLKYILGLAEVAGMVGFNCLYLTMCTDLSAQFKILKLHFITMKYEKSSKCFNRYKVLLHQHAYLLRYVEHVLTVYMKPLIVLYALTIITCCMEVLNVKAEGSNITQKVGSLLFSSTILFQMALFCIPSSNLQKEILDTSDAIYLGAWEDGPLELQGCVILALARAQKVVVFKTAGLVTINNETFVDVFRKTFSFLTLIQQMEAK